MSRPTTTGSGPIAAKEARDMKREPTLRRTTLYVLTLVAGLAATGCTGPASINGETPFVNKPGGPYRVFQSGPDEPAAPAPEAQLSDLSIEVAGKILYELKQDDDRHLTSRVAVVSAVPLSDLKRETEFGRMVAEFLLTDLADRGLRVTELRLGREISIIPQAGEFILSQNVGELATTAPLLDYVVLSTYTNTTGSLVLQGRLVSLRSGQVVTSWRYTLPLTRDLAILFRGEEATRPNTINVKGTMR